MLDEISVPPSVVSNLPSVSQQTVHLNSKRYKMIAGGFTLIVVVATIPLYATYSFSYSKEVVDVHADWPEWLRDMVEFAIPLSSITVNVGQNVFGAIQTADGFRRIFGDTTTQPIWKKIACTGGAAILCILPSVPAISAAFLAKNSNFLWQWLTRIATPICVLPFNFYSSLATLQDTVPEVVRNAIALAKGAAGEWHKWQNTLMLKALVVGILEDTYQKLQEGRLAQGNLYNTYNAVIQDEEPQADESHVVAALNKFVTKDGLAKNVGKSYGFFKKTANSFKRLTVKSVVAGLVESAAKVAVGGILVASWGGYACATEKFTEENFLHDKNNSWIAASVAMLPLYYIAGKFGYQAVSTLFRRCLPFFKQPDAELPYCLRYYPKTTLALGVTTLMLSSLTFATSIKLIEEDCPIYFQTVLKKLIYGGTPLFNTVVCWNFIDTVMRKLTLHYHADEIMAEKLLAFLDKLIIVVKEMPVARFAAIMKTHGAELLLQGVSAATDVDKIAAEVDQEQVRRLLKGSHEEFKQHEKAAQPNEKTSLIVAQNGF